MIISPGFSGASWVKNNKMPNQYYCISNTANYKEIKNVFPQAHFDNTDIPGADAAKKLMNKPVPDGLVFNFTLDKKTIATDVLSQSYLTSFGLLISERMYEWLKAFNLANIQFISSKVKNGADVLQYYWLHPVKESFDCIDYAQTGFVLKDKASDKVLYDFKPKNTEALKQKLLNKPFDKAMLPKDGISFTAGAACMSDIIFLPRIDLSIFISEKIKNHLINNSASGIYLSGYATEIHNL